MLMHKDWKSEQRRIKKKASSCNAEKDVERNQRAASWPSNKPKKKS